MKRILLTLAVIVVLVFAALAILISTRPAGFSISRSTTIAAPREKVFTQVNDFHLWQDWSPWAKLDPSAETAFEGPASGSGAAFTWSGNAEVGAGRQEIVESVPHDLIRIRLDFSKPTKATNEVLFVFKTEGQGTKVTWTMSGTNNFIGKAFSLVMDCEKLLGPPFEQGLANLKAVSEKPAGS